MVIGDFSLWACAAEPELRGLLSAEAGLAIPGRTGYLSAIEQAHHPFVRLTLTGCACL